MGLDEAACICALQKYLMATMSYLVYLGRVYVSCACIHPYATKAMVQCRAHVGLRHKAEIVCRTAENRP